MEKIRIDRFLASQLKLTRSEAKALLKSGGVTVNGAKVSGIDAAINQEDFKGDGVILKKGKKVFHRAFTL